MKATLFLCAVVATVYMATALPVHIEVKDFQRFIEFPDGEGMPHQVDLKGEPDMELLNEITRNPARNLYLLYTRNNPTTAQPLVIDDPDSITSSNFNPQVPTIVISHGWLSNQNTGINPTIRDVDFFFTQLAKKLTGRLIRTWAKVKQTLADYVTAILGVPAVGRCLGQFIRFLNSVTGVSYDSIHLVGFSLGAHLVGNAGRELGGQVARVTG
ncbi:pancreatic lipase-related protein 2-like [Aphomia sociella]